MMSKTVSKIIMIFLLFGMATFVFKIQPARAVIWGEVATRTGSPFPDVEEFTMDFEISHSDWRIRYSYDAVGSDFESIFIIKLDGELFIYSSGFFDESDLRNVYNDSGNFRLDVTCANVYEYTIIIEQNVDSPFARTVYIRADGSIDPSTMPISTVDQVTYNFIDNIDDWTIVVERDNIIIDGNGYTLQRTKTPQPWSGVNGIDLTGRTNVVIKNIKIKNLSDAIILYDASDNVISGNNLDDNSQGIVTFRATGNHVTGNTIKNNHIGIVFNEASNNIINGNNIMNNEMGIVSFGGSNNIIHYNNFIDNDQQNGASLGADVWDDGYPNGGNYWSDYNGQDNDNDGIGDTAYIIDENDKDQFPLMNIISDLHTPDSPIPTPTPSPTPTPTATPTPTTQPSPTIPELPTTIALVSVMVIGTALLIYFRKDKNNL